MSNKFFPPLKVILNGNVITQVKTSGVSFDPALNPVNTQEGRSGYSEGGRFISITGEMAIPNSGPQFNPTQKMNDRETVLVKVMVANLELETEGVFTAAELSWSEASDTGYSFTLECDFAELK